MTHFKINYAGVHFATAVQTGVNFAYNVGFITLHTARMK
jgi:hypothetical protein